MNDLDKTLPATPADGVGEGRPRSRPDAAETKTLLKEREQALAAALAESERMSKEIERLRRMQHQYQRKEGTSTEEYGIDGDLSSDLSRARSELEPETWEVQDESEKQRQDNVEELQHKLAGAEAQLADRDSVWIEELEREKRERMVERNALAEQLHAAEKEANDRRRQLLDLKQNISAITRTESQVTDSELAERMEQLFNRIRGWIVSNYRRSKLQTDTISEDAAGIIATIAPDHAALPGHAKIHLYSGIVAKITTRIVNGDFLWDLPGEGAISHIRGAMEIFKDTTPAFQHWRALSMRLLRDNEGFRQRTKELCTETADQTLPLLQEISGFAATGESRLQLYSIFEECANLALLFHMQRAYYQVQMPPIDPSNILMFDPVTMENVNVSEDGEMQKVQIDIVVFPSVVKHGDEAGTNLQLRNVITKAKVFC